MRGGQGERRVFRVCINWLGNTYGDIVVKNLDNVPIMGRWDDMLSLLDTVVETAVVDYVKAQLSTDIKTLKENQFHCLQSGCHLSTRHPRIQFVSQTS